MAYHDVHVFEAFRSCGNTGVRMLSSAPASPSIPCGYVQSSARYSPLSSCLQIMSGDLRGPPLTEIIRMADHRFLLYLYFQVLFVHRTELAVVVVMAAVDFSRFRSYKVVVRYIPCLHILVFCD